MRIRRLVEQVDEQHREAMRTIEDDLGDLHFGARSAAADESRRRFVRSLGVGGAVALGAVAVPTALLAGAASAQTSGSSSDEEELPDKRPRRRRVRGRPRACGGSGLHSGRSNAVVRLGAGRHGAHVRTPSSRACRCPGHARRDAMPKPSGYPTERDRRQRSHPRIQSGGTADGVWEVLFGVEQGAAATYLETLGTFESAAAAGPAASILPIESQHATVIGSMLELPIDEWMPPFQTTEGAFDPATYAG